DLPAADPDKLVPVADPGGGDLDQDLARGRRSRLVHIEDLDRLTECCDPGRTHPVRRTLRGRRHPTSAATSSGTAPEPTVHDQAANKSDTPPAGCIQGDHADQHECEHHQGCAALPVAVGACVHEPGYADEKCDGEEDSAGLGEPKPVSEPSPITS